MFHRIIHHAGTVFYASIYLIGCLIATLFWVLMFGKIEKPYIKR